MMEPINFYDSKLQEALEGLENHWVKMINLQDKDKVKLEKRGKVNFISWFGDLEHWLVELKDVDYGSYPEFDLSASKIYPKAIRDKVGIRNIAKELDLLLPKDNPAICDILPVLITAYIVNRRSPKEKKGIEDSAVDYQGTPGFTDFLLYSVGPKLTKEDKKAGRETPKKVIDPRKMLQNKEKLFLLKNWDDSFPKIKYSQINKGKAQMLLSGYGCMRLFFFLLYKLQNVCNVSLSYFMFEVMTRYIDLQMPDGKYLWEKNHGKNYPWFASEKEIEDKRKKTEILAWIKEEFEDIINHEEGSAETDLPMSLYRYLYNVKEELIIREEKERGSPLSDEEINAGYKLFADLDFIFGFQNSSQPLSNFIDSDIMKMIEGDAEKIEKIGC